MATVSRKTIDDTLDVLRTVGLPNAVKYGEEFENDFASNKKIWIMYENILIPVAGIQWQHTPLLKTDAGYSGGPKFTWDQYSPLDLDYKIPLDKNTLESMAKFGNPEHVGFPMGFIIPDYREKQIASMASLELEKPFSRMYDIGGNKVNLYPYPAHILPTIGDLGEVKPIQKH